MNSTSLAALLQQADPADLSRQVQEALEFQRFAGDGKAGGYYGAAFSPNDLQPQRRGLGIWHLPTFRLLARLRADRPFTTLAVSRDARLIAAGDSRQEVHFLQRRGPLTG